MVTLEDVPVSHVHWQAGTRIVRSVYPPIDLFEDISDPEDWPLLISGEQKTNPRLMDTIGNLDLVPHERRVGGAGSSYLMAPFTHTGVDRPSRFSDGRLGVLYIASDFDTAVEETIYHHARFMSLTNEAPGWTSQFREIVVEVDANLHDIRGLDQADILSHPTDYSAAQRFAGLVRSADGDGIAYTSVRGPGDCVGLFYPDLARNPVQGRHLDYHWNGKAVDLVRDAGTGDVFRVVPVTQ